LFLEVIGGKLDFIGFLNGIGGKFVVLGQEFRLENLENFFCCFFFGCQ
jgi:hypothetical protein